MSKTTRILLSLVGALPAAWFLYIFFLKGVVSEIASMPVPMMLGTGLAGAASAFLALIPLLTAAGLFGGAARKSPKKPKKAKATKDDALVAGSDASSAESFEGDAADLEGDSDFQTVEGDDPFEVTDNFESDIADADFESGESESFEDDFEVAPESEDEIRGR